MPAVALAKDILIFFNPTKPSRSTVAKAMADMALFLNVFSKLPLVLSEFYEPKDMAGSFRLVLSMFFYLLTQSFKETGRVSCSLGERYFDFFILVKPSRRFRE